MEREKTKLGSHQRTWREVGSATNDELTSNPSPFPHERLDASRIARQALVAAMRFTQSLPAGHADEARQINRAAASVVRNICEGADSPRGEGRRGWS